MDAPLQIPAKKNLDRFFQPENHFSAWSYFFNSYRLFLHLKKGVTITLRCFTSQKHTHTWLGVTVTVTGKPLGGSSEVLTSKNPVGPVNSTPTVLKKNSQPADFFSLQQRVTSSEEIYGRSSFSVNSSAFTTASLWPPPEFEKQNSNGRQKQIVCSPHWHLEGGILRQFLVMSDAHLFAVQIHVKRDRIFLGWWRRANPLVPNQFSRYRVLGL